MRPGSTRSSTTRLRRDGVTLIELLVVLVLAGAVAGAVVRAMGAQRRAVRDAVELAEVRSQLRQATHLLASEIRALAPSEGDVYEWSRDRLVIRSITGSSILCRRTSDSTVVLPPLELERDNALSSWLVHPQPGDSLMVLDPGARIDSSDDTWRTYAIESFSPVSALEGCSSSTAFTHPDDDARPSFQVRIDAGAGLPRTVTSGSPIRVFHPVRYELYRGTDSRWYLGASDCRGARTPPCGTIQPVSGPYLPRSSRGADSGLELTYLDENGSELDPLLSDVRRLARVDMVVRGQSLVQTASRAGARDSLAVTAAVRNRRLP